MPGPTKKPAARRQRRNTPELGVVTGGNGTAKPKVAPPAAPKDWLVVTRSRWDGLWKSALAPTFKEMDHAALERLFGLYDERERCWRSYRKNRLVRGSQGQPVLNPLGRQIPILDGEIRQLEDRLGLTPKARVAMGVQLPEDGNGLPSLDDLNAQVRDGGDEEDPRLAVVDDAASQ